MGSRLGIVVLLSVVLGMPSGQGTPRMQGPAAVSESVSGRPLPGALVPLPPPVTKGKVSLEEVLATRRSVRALTGDPLTPERLGQLLWSAQGITQPRRGLRTAPSAGALYPLEVYAVTPEGVFKYQPADHAIRKVKTGDVRKDLAAAALGQSSVAQASADLVITAVYARTARKYGERAERYVHIEVGCAAENVLLQATALGLGAVPVGAFEDRAVKQVLGCPDEEEPLLIIPVGQPASR